MKFSKTWWGGTLSNIVGTIIGIILTFGVGYWVEYRNREKDKYLAKMVILSNMHDRITILQDAYHNITKKIETLEALLKVTPGEIKSLSQDSIGTLVGAIYDAYPSLTYNNYAKNLLNTNFDLVRSNDNFQFFRTVEIYSDLLDFAETTYKIHGPSSFVKKYNDEIEKLAIKQKIKEFTPKWQLEQIVTTDSLKILIMIYVTEFKRNEMDKFGDYFDNLTEELYKTAGATPEEVNYFLYNYNQNN